MRWALAMLFAVAGTLHFLLPGTYVRVVPPGLPAPRLLLALSGGAEIARVSGWSLRA